LWRRRLEQAEVVFGEEWTGSFPASLLVEPQFGEEFVGREGDGIGQPELQIRRGGGVRPEMVEAEAGVHGSGVGAGGDAIGGIVTDKDVRHTGRGGAEMLPQR